MTEHSSPLTHRGLVGRLAGIIFRITIIVLGPLGIALVGGYFYATGGRFITTDNAYVKADKILVSAEVSGPLVEVLVSENMRVANGQPLIRIDDMPFRIGWSECLFQDRQTRRG